MLSTSSREDRECNLVVHARLHGEPTVAAHLFYRAWDECLELQVMNRETWVLHALTRVCSVDRYEIGIMRDGVVVGGIALAHDDDVHVGECLSVISQYVLPEFRNTGVSMLCMREAVRIAKRLGHTTLAWTHRVKDWTYLTRYRRIQ